MPTRHGLAREAYREHARCEPVQKAVDGVGAGDPQERWPALRTALGLLDARHVEGDPELSRALLSGARGAWRAGADRRLPELRAAGDAREREHGEVAFLLEPDLKSGRGGLRDVNALRTEFFGEAERQGSQGEFVG